MKAVNPEALERMVAPGDEKLPPEEQTTLVLSQLSADEDAYIADIRGSGSRIMAALHLGLAGLENFNGPDGKPVKLVRDETAMPIVGDKKPWLQEQLTLIPFKVRDRAAARILSGVGLSEGEAKNS